MSDHKIRRKKGNLKSNIKAFHNLSNKNNIILAEAPADNDRITQQYESLLSKKSRYSEELKQQIDRRKLKKHHKFNKSLLNIKLSKFNGFSSKMDIYAPSKIALRSFI